MYRISKLSCAILFCLCSIFLFYSLGYSKPLTKQKSIPSFSTSVDNTTYIDANFILMFITNHGNFGRDIASVFGKDFGTWYPYEGNPDDITNNINGVAVKSPLYAAGLWIGGKVNDEIRVATSEYFSEYVPGPMINGTFSADDTTYKVYKLYAESLQTNPNSDYLNWPSDQGAPVDEQGRPLMRGEQMLWSVFNDADTNQHANMLTQPLGIEVQQTVWAQMEDGSDTIPPPTVINVTQSGTNNIVVSVNILYQDSLTGDDYEITYHYDSLNTRYWNLNDLTLDSIILGNQTSFNGNEIQLPSLGISIKVEDVLRAKEWLYESAVPQNLSPVATTDDPFYTGGRWFTGGVHGGDLFFGGVFIEPNWNGETSVSLEEIPTIEVRWRPMQSYTDLNGDGTYTIGEPYTVDDTSKIQKAFMYSGLSSSDYLGFFDVPFTVWDVSDSLNPRQLSVVIRDRDLNHAWDLHIQHDPLYTDTSGLPNSGDLRFNYMMISNSDYDSTGTYFGDGTGGTLGWWENYDGIWMLWLDERANGGMLAEEGIFTLVPGDVDTLPDTFTFNTTPYTPRTTGGDGLSVYMMYKLFNKGSNQIDSCFVSIWSDPDLGNASDDLVGCDTLSDIFFCYNDNPIDANYGIAPPAIGFKFIHGPLVPANGQTAFFDDVEVSDYKNLHMNSFMHFQQGADPDNEIDTYEYMKGYTRIFGQPYVYNGDTLTYMYSGDPVLGVGDLDTYSSDRRMFGTVGPFDFAPGDSQYVLVKMTVGQGTDNLNSITRMKEILNQPYLFSTGIHDENNSISIPSTFSLEQNYPNPFNPTTQIRFSLPVKSDVKIEVFNILGQKVSTVTNKKFSAGNHLVEWDASKFSTGLYFYKLTAGEYVQSRKMILLK